MARKGRKRVEHRFAPVSRAMVVPQISANPTYVHKFRFVASGLSAGAGITNAMVLLYGGAMAYSAIACQTINNSFRLKHIEMWAPPASQGTAATVSVAFNGTANNPSTEYSDTTVSTAIPAHLSVSAPRNSLAAFWQQSSASNLFQVVCPNGTIVDVTAEYIHADGTNWPGVIGPVIAGGSTGAIYYGSFGGSGSGPPTSLTTISGL